MSELFLKILNMSISAGWVILAVLVLRLLLKKAPKWVRVALWGVVAVRLLCLFSIESALSLIPSAQTVRPEIMLDPTPAVDTGVGFVNSIVNPVIAGSFTPNPATSANPLQILIPVWSVLWVAGVAAMLLYTAVSYLLLCRKVRTAVRFRDNLFQSENVASPFVLGIFRPRIYLPFRLEGERLRHVVAHEQAHIRRKDHWWKPLGFLLLSIHWFNPLAWIAYVLLCRDIELACDERVIRELGSQERADYTQALVDSSIKRNRIAACPLAFGEVDVKTRVKSVMNYKKPGFWLVVIAVVVCIAVAVCFLTDPMTSVDEPLAVFIDCQIADHHQSSHTGDHGCFLDWQVIGKEEKGNQITVYMWVLYEEYSYEEELTLETGAHILTAITAERVDGQYQLVEYWEPEDGANHAPSIREKLPMHLWSRAMDSQHYIGRQRAAIDEMVNSHYGIGQEEAKWDLIPMVMVDGELYLTTGYESAREDRRDDFDGEITSSVDGSERPTQNNQSNFGTGYGYQYGTMEGTVEIHMNGAWWIYATEEAREKLQYPSTDAAFEVNFAGNTSMQQKVELTEDQPYWYVHVINDGSEAIYVDFHGTVYRVESGTSATVFTDEEWKPGTYTVGFATSGASGMEGSAVCSTSSVPAYGVRAVIEYDLRNGNLEIPAEKLKNYVFLTNSTEIGIKVKCDGDFSGSVILKNYTEGDVEILYCDVSNQEDTCLFQNLTSALLYGVACEGLEDCTLIVSQKQFGWLP